MKKRDMILNQLGIYGWEDVSLYLFTCFLSGTTPCIIGSHGTGKTMGARRLAQALGMRYQLWDSSKATEEVLGGMFDIEQLKQGKTRYIQDPEAGAIWGKQVGIFDEITRMNPAIQNQLLEVFRNKTFNGMKTDLRLCIATANDLSYANTEPLEQAFASRIGMVFKAPEIYNMEESLRHQIIGNTEMCDNLMLKYWDSDFLAPEEVIDWNTISVELREFFQKAAQRYREIEYVYKNDFIKYVDTATQVLHKKAGIVAKNGSPDGSLDARREGIILRNIMAGLAVEYVEEELSTEQLQNVVELIWKHSFVFDLTGSKIDSGVINEAHATAQEYLTAKNLATVTILKEKNPYKQLMLSIVLHDQDPIALFEQIETLFTDPFDPDVSMDEEFRKEKKMQAYMVCMINQNIFGGKLFEKFSKNAQYTDVMTRIVKAETKITTEVLSSLDRSLAELREKESSSDPQKVIQEYLDKRFCEIVGKTAEEIKAEIEQVQTLKSKRAIDKATEAMRKSAAPWIMACQIMHLTMESKTMEKDLDYVQFMFDKALKYVNMTSEVFGENYEDIKQTLLAQMK